MKKILTICVVLLLTAATMLYAEPKKLTILHTNDLHSHFLGFSPNVDYTSYKTGDDNTLGGWARISTVFKEIREDRDNPVLTLDAGDYLMGSLFHMLCREEAFELQLMDRMGYDVTTLGNHEYDLFPDGLARIINSAKSAGRLPGIVASNVVFDKESKKDDSLEEVFKKGLVKPYLVMEKDGLKIGYFGLMGKNAAEVAPFSSPVSFSDTLTTAREMVKTLREKEKVDIVICLSHSGLWVDESKSEDEILAKEVDGIDIIISGHTHTKLNAPLQVHDTIIVQAWAYGRQVGVMDISFDNGKVTLDGYKLREINDTIKGDPVVTSYVDAYITRINRQVLRERGMRFWDTIATTRHNLVIEEDETNLGNLIADSIRWYVDKYDSDPNDPDSKVDIGVISNGVIRDNILVGETGKVAVCDAFRAIPLGIGMDGTMGYPLISIYVYGSEVKKALEILTSIYPLKGSDYFLQVSGVKFTYNPNRAIFDRVTEIWLGDEENGYKELDYSSSNKKLYKVSADLYNATFLKVVGNFTMQILNIVPKDKDGNPIEDLKTARVDMDKNKPGIQEIKEWMGVLSYIKSFPDTNGDGVADIPDKYSGKLGRNVVEASWNPYSLLKRGTWITWVSFLVFVIIVAVGFFLGRFIIKKVKK